MRKPTVLINSDMRFIAEIPRVPFACLMCIRVTFAFLGSVPLVIGVVYLLPLPLPRFADPYYQYLKRHGLLDATGKPLPDADIERILAERGGDTF